MANFTYKKATTTTLKVIGAIHAERGVIETDDDEKDIADLIKEFDEQYVEIQIKVKDEEELELSEPDETEE